MKKQTTRRPPAHLGEAGSRWFRETVKQFDFTSEPEWELVAQAAQTLDRLADCREQLARDGLTVATGQGGRKPHPALNAERDNKVLFARLCRELRLFEPVADDTGRAPRIGGR